MKRKNNLVQQSICNIMEGFVPVTRKDVRLRGKNSKPFYMSVLVSEKPFQTAGSGLEDRGRNKDYQFKIFATQPEPATDSLWVMKAFAVGEKRYYSFVCIADFYFVPSAETRKYQQDLFIEDVKRMVTDKEEAQADRQDTTGPVAQRALSSSYAAVSGRSMPEPTHSVTPGISLLAMNSSFDLPDRIADSANLSSFSK